MKSSGQAHAARAARPRAAWPERGSSCRGLDPTGALFVCIRRRDCVAGAMMPLVIDAMKERSLPLPGGCWKLRSIRLHQVSGRPQWRQRWPVHHQRHEQRRIRGPLTYELALKDSPIRQFFDDRLNAGLKDAQAAYRAAAGPILIPGVSREAADAGTIGTAADWMMRFLVHPNPSLRLAAQGASLCEMMSALRELAVMLGFRDGGVEEFTGPARGNSVEPDLLYRACWGLALLTEVYRRGPDIAAAGPIGRLRTGRRDR